MHRLVGKLRADLQLVPVCGHDLPEQRFAAARQLLELNEQDSALSTVILEFPSVEAAQAWYRSPEYQAAVPVRQAAAHCNGVIIAGFEPPGS